MTYGGLIEYEGQMGDTFRRDVTYPAVARRATQSRVAAAPAAKRRPRWVWFARRPIRATA